ncbi:flagellar basal body-associated protein FliL [uncultured Pseudokineococcus sp.]|uniref:flagellar basal body-associated FliL family protein n=1 Tax=uncultured Pseudokineococcus sp. TaxID=1642928 RepID=UPI0026104B84|nr:flagellar basal body-associated FliL family protein [uncultured Pseudokineococcus sp.]
MAVQRTTATPTTSKEKSVPGKTAAPAAADEAEAPKKKKLPLLIGAVVLLVAVAAGLWFFVLGGSSAEAAEEPAPEKGEVVALEPVSINLANGSYLRLGLALQQTADATHAAEGSEALDLAIKTFSGRTTEELNDLAVRDELKQELLVEVEEAYHQEVMDLYFTEFVTQ